MAPTHYQDNKGKRRDEMRNQDIHEAFKKSGVKKWLVAEKLGIADTTFSKKLRKELSQSDKRKILKAINEVNMANEMRECNVL